MISYAHRNIQNIMISVYKMKTCKVCISEESSVQNLTSDYLRRVARQKRILIFII